jgi:hypothetical protein
MKKLEKQQKKVGKTSMKIYLHELLMKSRNLIKDKFVTLGNFLKQYTVPAEKFDHGY